MGVGGQKILGTTGRAQKSSKIIQLVSPEHLEYCFSDRSVCGAQQLCKWENSSTTYGTVSPQPAEIRYPAQLWVLSATGILKWLCSQSLFRGNEKNQKTYLILKENVIAKIWSMKAKSRVFFYFYFFITHLLSAPSRENTFYIFTPNLLGLHSCSKKLNKKTKTACFVIGTPPQPVVLVK